MQSSIVTWFQSHFAQSQIAVLVFRQRREEAREEARRQKAEEQRIRQAAAAEAAAEAEAVRMAEAAAQQVGLSQPVAVPWRDLLLQ